MLKKIFKVLVCKEAWDLSWKGLKLCPGYYKDQFKVAAGGIGKVVMRKDPGEVGKTLSKRVYRCMLDLGPEYYAYLRKLDLVFGPSSSIPKSYEEFEHMLRKECGIC